MGEQYRQLTPEDSDIYLSMIHAAYAPIRELGIHFDAATASREQVTVHLARHGVWGLFLDGTLAASLTLRYPWGPLPGPFGLPHIGWFGTHPDYRGQQRGRQLLDHIETHVLLGTLRAPAVSLGTALSHPWLQKIYTRYGFIPQHTADLGKGHITLYMKKVLDEQAHARWLARTSAEAFP